MGTKAISFRIPPELLKYVDTAAAHYKRSRSTVLIAALRLLSRQLQEQGGEYIRVELPADALEEKALFPYPENRGGRPRKNKAAVKA